MTSLQQLEFFTTVNHLADLPPSIAEVAFAGRSNAGKSSALNTLARHGRLAFVSKTPGRTQHINYFKLAESRYVVDLPGYGYAKVPDAIRAHWQTLLSRYLQNRAPLKGLVIVMDTRHPLTPLDWQMLHWFSQTQKPIHVLLTKSDKLSRHQAAVQLQNVRDQLAALPTVSVQLFSSLNRIGLPEAEACVLGWLNPPPQTEALDEDLGAPHTL